MIERFKELFTSKLQDSECWHGFQFIISRLDFNRPGLIVETGTAREKDNWRGDGQSTLIWDWLAKEFGFDVFSVDIDLNAVQIAQEQATSVQVRCSDSIFFLRSFLLLKKSIYSISILTTGDATKKKRLCRNFIMLANSQPSMKNYEVVV